MSAPRGLNISGFAAVFAGEVHRELRAAICNLVVFCVATAALGADSSTDTIAKYLAGMAVPAAPPGVETTIETTPLATPAARASSRPAVTAAPAVAQLASPPPGSMIPQHRWLPSTGPVPTASRESATNNASERAAAGNPKSESTNPWLLHSAELDRAWKHTETAQLANIATWAPQNLGSFYRDTTTMFYMFSGPDFLYAHAFFPSAHTYILVGNEPVGTPPDLDKIPPQTLAATLANVRKSLESVLSWSFFITKNMKTDLAQPQLNGTIPLLYVFLARLNCTIDSVTPVAIDHNGNLIEDEKGETQGVRIVFRNPASTSSADQTSTLFYFCTDLSDDGIKSTPGLLRFCEQQGRGVSLLKAASYLMHEPGFSRVRQFLLEHSELIVQDDSGIPFRYFEPQSWTIQLWGPYAGPIDVFKKYWQQDLAEQFGRMAGTPLPFGFGYQWQPSRSNLMIASRRSLNAQR